MNCKECGSKMTMLFTSYVCDVCNPPDSVIVKSTQLTLNSTYEKMWIYHDEDPRTTLIKSGLFLVYPRENKYDAVDAMYLFNKAIYENTNSRLYRVYYKCRNKNNSFTWFVESEQYALDKLRDDINIAWLCE